MGINLGGNFGMSNNDSIPVLNLQKNDIKESDFRCWLGYIKKWSRF